MIGFQSTCPARGTTGGAFSLAGDVGISIHVPREGHDVAARLKVPGSFQISIHVPREGHDQNIEATFIRGNAISIHVPREGHDSKHAQFFRANLRKSYKYPAERDALPTKNVCKHIKTLG